MRRHRAQYDVIVMICVCDISLGGSGKHSRNRAQNNVCELEGIFFKIKRLEANHQMV